MVSRHCIFIILMTTEHTIHPILINVLESYKAHAHFQAYISQELGQRNFLQGFFAARFVLHQPHKTFRYCLVRNKKNNPSSLRFLYALWTFYSCRTNKSEVAFILSINALSSTSSSEGDIKSLDSQYNNPQGVPPPNLCLNPPLSQCLKTFKITKWSIVA